MATHVRTTIVKGRNLKVRDDGLRTSSLFVRIKLNNGKFVTSTLDCPDGNIEWNEECDLPLDGHHCLVLSVRETVMFGSVELGRAEVQVGHLLNDEETSQWLPLRLKLSNALADGELLVKLKVFPMRNYNGGGRTSSLKILSASTSRLLRKSLSGSFRNLGDVEGRSKSSVTSSPLGEEKVVFQVGHVDEGELTLRRSSSLMSPARALDADPMNRTCFRAELLPEPASMGSAAMLSAMPNFTNASQFVDASTADDRQSANVPKALQVTYGYWDRAELISRIGLLETQLERCSTEYDQTKAYLDALLERVMLDAPELLSADEQ